MRKELKVALVAKRLSMLQDDDHHHNQSLLQVMLTPEIPVPRESKRSQVLSDDEFVGNRESIAEIQQKISKSHKRAKVGNNDESRTKARELSSCRRGRSSSMKQAEAIREKLGSKYPSFIKFMLKSHVSGGFWLGLPRIFCDEHLPDCDTNMLLVDEAGNESHSKYLAGKKGLSGGWRGFSIDHGLLEGDVLVFRLIARDKFKIYIVREQNSGEVRDLGPQTLDCNVGQHNSVLETDDRTQNAMQISEPIQETQTSMDSLPKTSSELDSEVHEGIQFSDTATNFETVITFANFKITVDGFTIDSKFSDSTRKKYYELCRTQNSFLHEHLHKGLNSSLVVGIISEIVNISDAVTSCEVGSSSSHEDLQIWERTLEGFEFLGMKVGFLRARVNQLMGLSSDHAAEESSNRLKEAIIRRALAGERMKALEKKLIALKETMEKINFEMDDEINKVSGWKQEAKFKKFSAVLS